MNRLNHHPKVIRPRPIEQPIIPIFDEIDPELAPERWREYCKKNSSDGET